MNIYKEGERPERCNARSFKEYLDNCKTGTKIRVKVDKAPALNVLILCAQRGIPIFFSRKATLAGYTRPAQIPLPYSYFVPGGRVLLDNTIFKSKVFPEILEASLDDFLTVLDIALRGLLDKVYLGYLDGNFVSRYEAPFIAKQGIFVNPIYQGTSASGSPYSVITNDRYKGNFFEVKNEDRVQYIMDVEYRGEPGVLRVLFSNPVHISGEELFHLVKQTETKAVSHNLFSPGNKKQFIARVNLSVAIFSGCHRFIKAGTGFGLKMFA
jgi:hypothetical protein